MRSADGFCHLLNHLTKRLLVMPLQDGRGGGMGGGFPIELKYAFAFVAVCRYLCFALWSIENTL